LIIKASQRFQYKIPLRNLGLFNGKRVVAPKFFRGGVSARTIRRGVVSYRSSNWMISKRKMKMLCRKKPSMKSLRKKEIN
jgi:hypothetical protein